VTDPSCRPSITSTRQSIDGVNSGHHKSTMGKMRRPIHQDWIVHADALSGGRPMRRQWPFLDAGTVGIPFHNNCRRGGGGMQHECEGGNEQNCLRMQHRELCSFLVRPTDTVHNRRDMHRGPYQRLRDHHTPLPPAPPSPAYLCPLFQLLATSCQKCRDLGGD
jgi:hypothetical protein